MVTTAQQVSDPIDSQSIEDIRAKRLPMREEIEGPAGARLWDNVDNCWTGYLPANAASIYARKVVYRCTACTMSSMWAGQVSQHIEQVKSESGAHKKARLKTVMNATGQAAQVCSGCGLAFPLRKGMGEKHVARAKEMIVSHVEAKEVLVRRFSFQPPQKVMA